MNLCRILDARRAPRRRCSRRHRTVEPRDGVGDVGRAQAAGEHQLRRARQLRARCASRLCSPMPLTGPSKRMRWPAELQAVDSACPARPASRCSPVGHPQRREILDVRLQHVRPKLRPHFIELELCVGCSITATRGHAAARLCASSAARCARSPAASTARTRNRSHPALRACDRSPSTASIAWSGRRSCTQIATPLTRFTFTSQRPARDRAILRVRTAIARSRPAASISPSSLRGSAEFISVVPMSATSIADVDDRLDVVERADAALRDVREVRRQVTRPARCSRGRSTLSLSRSRQLTPTSICSSCALRAASTSLRDCEIGGIERFEQHEHLQHARRNRAAR